MNECKSLLEAIAHNWLACKSRFWFYVKQGLVYFKSFLNFSMIKIPFVPNALCLLGFWVGFFKIINLNCAGIKYIISDCFFCVWNFRNILICVWLFCVIFQIFVVIILRNLSFPWVLRGFNNSLESCVSCGLKILNNY